jgi:hypothetical protein
MKKKILLSTAGTIALLLVLAIAVLNLRPGRMSGPTTPVASTIRTINTSEVTFASIYSAVGYAPNLSVFGPADSGNCDSSHACLLDNIIACSVGTGQGWCRKGLYRYNVQSSSSKPPYKDYWVTATPIEAKPGMRSYCSLSDAVMRSEPGVSRIHPYTLQECRNLPYDPDSYHP